MKNLLVTIDTDIVVQKQLDWEDPIAAGNLRELLKIDPRIDQSKIGAARYMWAKDKPGAGLEEEEEEASPGTVDPRTGRVQAKTNKTRTMTLPTVDEDEDGDFDYLNDAEPSPLHATRNLTPRMRHTRSYRCQSDKEINDLR